ncbi:MULTISPECIES: hypothetical protein [Sphingobium]|uniref:hypothetical protein n=1 Tax=Sphingobium TaxID=165695 RepID=UPI000C5059B0|nr:MULTISPECIES: hypothetical protein [Sphingobium]MBS49638.1 hypothetical protein [Sphingobium sp.]MCC4254989.1 hypothetical protein [Sphingobium lactosutens]HCW60582.1 hypothetical protein [Sphingobium sp.]
MYEPPKTAFRGASRAILTAGPLCVALSLAAMAYMELPDAIDLEPAALLGIPVVLLFALIFGPFVACSPIAAGTFLMHHLADRFDILSARPAWAAAGLLTGAAFVWAIGLFTSSGTVSFALIATSGVCAWLSHSRTAA